MNEGLDRVIEQLHQHNTGTHTNGDRFAEKELVAWLAEVLEDGLTQVREELNDLQQHYHDRGTR